MAKSINNVTLMGNLTRDPELRQTPNGQNVCTFSLALNRSYKDGDGNWQEATDFIDVVAWATLAERVSTYLGKGSRALVQGRLQSRSWEQDGQKRSKVEVLANDVTFLDNNNTSEGADSQPRQSRAAAPAAEPQSSANDDDDNPINLDDIPF